MYVLCADKEGRKKEREREGKLFVLAFCISFSSANMHQGGALKKKEKHLYGEKIACRSLRLNMD